MNDEYKNSKLYKKYKKIGTENDRKKITSKIAFMNLKKESEKSSTNIKKLKEAAKIDKEFIKRQLDLYLNNDDIKIIFLCGKDKKAELYSNINDILENKIKNAKTLWEKDGLFLKKVNDKLFIIKFYHFKPIGIENKKLYELMKEIKEKLDENISRN
jgi:hypothetical protein